MAFVHEAGGDVDGAAGGVVLVVVEDEGALVVEAVGVGEDVLVDCAVAVPEVVEGEVGAAGEDVALLEQRRDLALWRATRSSLGHSSILACLNSMP